MLSFFIAPVEDFNEYHTSIVSIPIRRFKHEETQYTILACAYLTYPLKTFYRIRVTHRKDAEYRRLSDRDFRILKKILIKKPIHSDQHAQIKSKLHRMVVEKKLEVYERENSQDHMEPFTHVRHGGKGKLDSYVFDINDYHRSICSHELVCSGIDRYNKVYRNEKYKMADQMEGWCVRFFKTLNSDGRFPVSYFLAITYILDCSFNKYMYTDNYNPGHDLLYNLTKNVRNVLKQAVNKFLQHYMSYERWQVKHIHCFNRSHYMNSSSTGKELTIFNPRTQRGKFNYKTKDYMTMLLNGVRSDATQCAGVDDTDEACGGGILRIYSLNLQRCRVHATFFVVKFKK